MKNIMINVDILTDRELKDLLTDSVKKLLKLYESISANVSEKNNLSELIEILEAEVLIRKIRNMTIGNV